MDKLKNFLNSIEQFYQPKDASEKDGIGHEIEHIKGVIERMHIIAQTINENPSLYQETKVDYNIATTVAALHDIGNTINRDDHNHLGYGIIMGKLTPSDILKAPTKGNTLLSATEKHNILSHFKNNKVTNVENLSPNESSGVQNICKIMTKFDIGYYGSELFKKDQIEDITQTDVATYIQKKFGISNDFSYDIADALFKNGKLDDIQYNPNLKDVTEEIQSVYKGRETELQTIAEAVQDHNIDFNGQGRYTARSTYGMMVADADKDDYATTFGLRTFAYSINKWPQKVKEFFTREEEGKSVPDFKKCASHIYDQAWERFRQPLEVGSEEEKHQHIPNNILQYKNSLSGIKGIVTDIETYQNEFQKKNPHLPMPTVHMLVKESEAHLYTDEKEDLHIVPDNSKIFEKAHSGDKYIIVQNYGDDVYSQIDAKFQPEHTDNRDGNIMSLRKEFLEVAAVWAQIAEHPEKEKELLSDYVKSHTEKAISAILYKATEIGNLFKDASSIESAVDIGETSEKLLPKICESEKQKQSGPLAKPVCDIVKSTLIGNKTLQQGIQEVANVFGINVNDISQNRSFEATIERCTTAETPPSQSQGQNEKSTDKDNSIDKDYSEFKDPSLIANDLIEKDEQTKNPTNMSRDELDNAILSGKELPMVSGTELDEKDILNNDDITR